MPFPPEDIVMYSVENLENSLTLAGLSEDQIKIIIDSGGPISNSNKGVFDIFSTGETPLPINHGTAFEILVEMTNEDPDDPVFVLTVIDNTSSNKIIEERIIGKIPPRND